MDESTYDKNQASIKVGLEGAGRFLSMQGPGDAGSISSETAQTRGVTGIAAGTVGIGASLLGVGASTAGINAVLKKPFITVPMLGKISVGRFAGLVGLWAAAFGPLKYQTGISFAEFTTSLGIQTNQLNVQTRKELASTLYFNPETGQLDFIDPDMQFLKEGLVKSGIPLESEDAKAALLGVEIKRQEQSQIKDFYNSGQLPEGFQGPFETPEDATKRFIDYQNKLAEETYFGNIETRKEELAAIPEQQQGIVDKFRRSGDVVRDETGTATDTTQRERRFLKPDQPLPSNVRQDLPLKDIGDLSVDEFLTIPPDSLSDSQKQLFMDLTGKQTKDKSIRDKTVGQATAPTPIYGPREETPEERRKRLTKK